MPPGPPTSQVYRRRCFERSQAYGWSVPMSERLPKDRNVLPPSVMSCECLDGPYAGRIIRVGVRAAFVDVRDSIDPGKPHERYRIEEIECR